MNENIYLDSNDHWNIGYWIPGDSPINSKEVLKELKEMGASLPFWNYIFLWALVLKQQEVAKLCLQKVEVY
ncbi:hypothetical protein DPMN_045929 [Dreissena polymorpha]|uniref:Uncharacterized protein n=1 Tax=Dreissena polymorpha TaxID=45954 RepID=A0A9D4D770_DREPO|nr:hypothetical protein DPMN_045929 [Dreissena polymorpha]